jgi:glycerate 2-kinase
MFDPLDHHKEILASLGDLDLASRVSAALSDILSAENLSGPLYILAFGKCAEIMSKASERIAGTHRVPRLLIVSNLLVNEVLDLPGTDIETIESDHPIPTERSISAAIRVISWVSEIPTNGILVNLISGGGSAMICAPRVGLAFEVKRAILKKLLISGVPEREINILRKAMSRVKGGKLLEHFQGNTVVNIYVSDESDDQVEAISSGPTVPHRQVSPEGIVNRYSLHEKLSAEEIHILNDFQPNTSESHINAPKLIFNRIVATRHDLFDKIGDRYRKKGYFVVDSGIHFRTKDVDSVCRRMIRFAEEKRSCHRGSPIVILFSGEIQVCVPPDSGGQGGRNQHLVAQLIPLSLQYGFNFDFIALATDGIDFLPGVHGAYLPSPNLRTPDTARMASHYLEHYDTNALHRKLGTLVTGNKSGYNFSDIFLMFVAENE